MVRIFFTSLYLPCSLFNQALARDGYRCMITGMIDETSLGNCVDLQAIQEHDGTSDVTIQTAHILNESCGAQRRQHGGEQGEVS